MSTSIDNQAYASTLRPPIEDDEAVKNLADSYGKYFSFNDLTQQQVSTLLTGRSSLNFLNFFEFFF